MKPANDWRLRHRRIWDTPPDGRVAGLVLMVNGLQSYAQSHGDAMACDGVLGRYWLGIAKGIIGLLDDDLPDGLDRGTVDGLIRRMMALNGFND